jgi:hypothetical protein
MSVENFSGIDKIEAELAAITGLKPVDKNENGSKPSLSSRLNETEKNIKETYADVSDQKDLSRLTAAAETVKNQYRKFSKELQEHGKLPIQTEIAEIRKDSTLKEQLEMDRAFVAKAFGKSFTSEDEGKSSVKELSLSHIDERDPATMTAKEWAAIRKTGEPYIFYKQIQVEQKGWFGKTKKDKDGNVLTENSGEVLVVMVMNNGNKAEENTVVTVVASHESGKLRIGDGYSCMYSVKSEASYRREMPTTGGTSPELSPTAGDRLARGEVTVAQYRSLYKQEQGRTIDQYWENHDAEVTAAPDTKNPHAGEILEQRDESLKKRQEMLANLSNQYTERLQKLENIGNEIITDTNAKITEIENRQETIQKDGYFADLFKDFVESTSLNDKRYLRAKKHAADYFKVSENYLQGLVDKYEEN